MPVFVLYFLRHMPLADVLRLEAIYYLGVVALEVPSGYLADRVGRRLTLLLATALSLSAYLLFCFADSFPAFALAQVLLAAGLAFNSGTDTSLHYDSLAELGRAEEYDQREAAAMRNTLFASALAGLGGGAVALLDLRLAYVLSAVAALASFVIVLTMREPAALGRPVLPPSPGRQFARCVGLLCEPVLGWVFAVAVALTVLNHIPYEFYQPYVRLALSGVAVADHATPLATGLHMAATMLLAALVAARSILVRDRLGLVATLLGAAGLQVLIIAALALLLHPLVVLLALLRSFPRALSAAPINAAIAPRVDRAQRATFLSLQSLLGRLSFGGFLIALSFVGPAEEGGAWEGLSTRLQASAGFGVAIVVLLWLIRPRSPQRG